MQREGEPLSLGVPETSSVPEGESRQVDDLLPEQPAPAQPNISTEPVAKAPEVNSVAYSDDAAEVPNATAKTFNAEELGQPVAEDQLSTMEDRVGDLTETNR
jgi:hypothetical protein